MKLIQIYKEILLELKNKRKLARKISKGGEDSSSVIDYGHNNK